MASDGRIFIFGGQTVGETTTGQAVDETTTEFYTIKDTVNWYQVGGRKLLDLAMHTPHE